MLAGLQEPNRYSVYLRPLLLPSHSAFPINSFELIPNWDGLPLNDFYIFCISDFYAHANLRKVVRHG